MLDVSYDELGSQYPPARLALRERHDQSAQNHRTRRPRKTATARGSRSFANGNDRSSGWPASAQLRVAPGIPSEARDAGQTKRRRLRAYTRAMRGAAAGRHSILSSVSESVSDQ